MTELGRTFYNPVTGLGLYATTQTGIEPYPDWVEGRYDMQEYYFPGGVPTLLLDMTPTVTGNDPAVAGEVVAFTGFPDDAVVTVNTISNRVQLTDGALNFTPTTPGVYHISAAHPAYKPRSYTIHAS